MTDWGVPRTKMVTWHDPAIAGAAAATMTGREFLQAMIDGRVPPPPFAELIGAELISVGDGVAVFRCAPDESTFNPLGLVHGGVVCTLLDSAAGCAVHSQLPAGVGFSSIEIKVSFLAPANGVTLEIEGRVAARRATDRVCRGARPRRPTASSSGTPRRRSRCCVRGANESALAGRRAAGATKLVPEPSESEFTPSGAASVELVGVKGTRDGWHAGHGRPAERPQGRRAQRDPVAPIRTTGPAARSTGPRGGRARSRRSGRR